MFFTKCLSVLLLFSREMVKRRKKQKFKSQVPPGTYKKLGLTGTNDAYNIWMDKSRQLKNHQMCILCDKPATIIHHPFGRKEYENILEYVFEDFLTPLCELCHIRIHSVWHYSYLMQDNKKIEVPDGTNIKQILLKDKIKFCPNCGVKIIQLGNYCTACGYKLIE